MNKSNLTLTLEGKGRPKLSVKDQARYETLKAHIQESFKLAYCEDLKAAYWLLEIRDHKLYRATYDTFEEFCLKELAVKRRRAYQIIEASVVIKELPENVQNSAQTLSHLEELAKVLPGKRAAVYALAQEGAVKLGKPLTAKIIRDAAIKLGALQRLLKAPGGADGETKPAETPEQIQGRKLCGAWNRAGHKVRRDFMLFLARDSDFKSVANVVLEDDRLLARDFRAGGAFDTEILDMLAGSFPEQGPAMAEK